MPKSDSDAEGNREQRPAAAEAVSKKVDVPGSEAWLASFSGSKTMQAWRLWHLLNSQVVDRCDSSLKNNTRLDLLDLYILSALDDAPSHKMRMSELASALGFSAPRMTYRINKLVQRGFAVRETQADDARSQVVRITDEGKAEKTTAGELHELQIDEIFRNAFSEEELDQLRTVAASLLAMRLF